MSEEPQLPAIPSIGGLDKKDQKRLKAIKITTTQCTCGEKFQRQFVAGDYLYEILDQPCLKCGKPQTTVVEIYQEYVPRIDFPKIVEKLNKTGKFEE
ncbi:MAG TPA: hypothetical protein VKK79_12790 [Candidatus Lokiarchaeia archaeon]|nr:hypothetical protein [Candidatus Lokiarchaeia archaeon]